MNDPKDYSLISDIFIYLYRRFVPSGNRTHTSHSTGRALLIKPSVTVNLPTDGFEPPTSPILGSALPPELHQHIIHSLIRFTLTGRRKHGSAIT